MNSKEVDVFCQRPSFVSLFGSRVFVRGVRQVIATNDVTYSALFALRYRELVAWPQLHSCSVSETVRFVRQSAHYRQFYCQEEKVQFSDILFGFA